jgi:hypothetical protein
VDDLLIAMIIAGIGLSGAYLRAECVLHRRFKAAERKKLIVQRELYAHRLPLTQKDLAVAALRNHQHFLSKESALHAPAEWPSAPYSRKSTDVGIVRHRELA